jgi:UDP-N-acetylglucosamine 2-epimerase
MIHAICVAGARPNLIKIKPVIDGLESRGAKTTFVHTGQHYDEAMSGVFLNDLGLRQPDLSPGVGWGTHAEQTAGVMVAFEPVSDGCAARHARPLRHRPVSVTATYPALPPAEVYWLHRWPTKTL